MSARDERRAREAAEEAAREAARMTQAQVDALATQLVADAGRSRAKVRIDSATAQQFTTSVAAYYDHRGSGATGTLADGRRWRCESKNPWSGYHLSIG